MHCTTTTPYVSQALPCESKLSIESDVKVYWGDECEIALSGVRDRRLCHVPRGAFLKPLGSGLLPPIFCNFLLRCTGVSDSAPAGYFTEELQARRGDRIPIHSLVITLAVIDSSMPLEVRGHTGPA